jgi:preprotein translocase subunit SecA
VQLVFEQQPPPESRSIAQNTPVKKTFNAMGVAETAPPPASGGNGDKNELDEPTRVPPPRAQPLVVGAGGRPRSLEAGAGGGGIPPGTDLTKVGRNDPCPCGSGKKFKKCHGS